MVVRISAVHLTLFLYVRYIENKYLGLKNGILDPSAILLSRYGYLTFMDCKVILLHLYEVYLISYWYEEFLFLYNVSTFKATELFNKTHMRICLHDELVP